MDPSVTTWIGLLKTGQEKAAQKLWKRYFPQLVRLARDKLHAVSGRESDEEDVALSAFYAFCRAANNGWIPDPKNRDDLWRTLVLITAGKAVDQRRYQQAQKRGGMQRSAPDELVLLEEVVGREPDPALAVQVAEECRPLLGRLDGEELQKIALCKLEGYTNEEIAGRLLCSLQTVKRRLGLIRRTWEAHFEGTSAQDRPRNKCPIFPLAA